MLIIENNLRPPPKKIIKKHLYPPLEIIEVQALNAWERWSYLESGKVKLNENTELREVVKMQSAVMIRMRAHACARLILLGALVLVHTPPALTTDLDHRP